MATPPPPPTLGAWLYAGGEDVGGSLGALREVQQSLLRWTAKRPIELFAAHHGASASLTNRAFARYEFVIPIVSPAFLRDEACSAFLERFREREAELGRDDLIFPVLYRPLDSVDARRLRRIAGEPVTQLLERRGWLHFGDLRRESPTHYRVIGALTELARRIDAALRPAIESSRAGAA